MTEIHFPIDHLKIDYKGPFEFNQLIRLITSYTKELGFDARYDKDYEINTKTGKQYDYQFFPWKKITDYARHQIKVQIATTDMVKKEIIRDGKKVKVDYGHLLIYIDGFLDLDYFAKWNKHPFFIFVRTLYNKFIYRAYTERFEQKLVYDVHKLYERIEAFLNMYKHYRVVTKSAGMEVNRSDA